VKPYYENDDIGVRLFLGDARSVLADLAPVDAIITDPPWPGAKPTAEWTDDPAGLFTETAVHFPRLVGPGGRLIVQLGSGTDPRMLNGIPPSLPFVRVCWLRFSVPRYRGTLLDGADVAYVYGGMWLGAPGKRVMPGEANATSSDAGRRRRYLIPHPCPRRLEHLEWLVYHFTKPGMTVLDPFAGSGTTLDACRRLGRPCIGVDTSAPYLDSIIERIERQPLLPLDMTG